MAGDDIREILFLCALQNAVKHGGVPQAGAVIGMVMGAHPELRGRAKEVSAMAKDAIADVAKLSPDERASTLQERAPEMMAALSEKHEHRKVLPDLEKAEKGVIMRFAPNPSGPLHIGHARAAALNDAYVKQYGGRYILRIEDTDPKRVDPEAYETVREDIRWLGLGITEVVTQSDRLPIYYDLCRQLIERKGAYVCTCDNEHFKELKMAKQACPCRDQSVEENLGLWQKMLDHSFREGEASVRIKTDLDHPDPAMRDFPAFRILDAPPHPKVKAHVYPLMNFSVVADDHLLGVSHVIRGKDHIANTRRQKYIYDHMGWEVPVYRHYGRMGIEGVVLSTSQMRAGIKEGTYTGWDDIRLGTLRALARRGISPVAVKNAMLAIGIGETDISFSWDNLYAENKKIVDPVANRYFFVPDPVRITIAGAPNHTARALLHPSDEARGTRTLEFTGDVLVPKAEITEGVCMIRLKDLFNVKVAWDNGTPLFSYGGDSLADARAAKARIIQWLPAKDTVPCILLTPDGEIHGSCEPRVKEELSKVVQFERVGFARIDSATASGITAYFTHK
ncbi:MULTISPECIES: glutamate--tRNA ligase [unclassified Methanoregula]|uniref:glutamate--tRNA ligase n=1 Tax=unclassified Methanoregula TaxID=2649730 RepID=UPI0009CD0D6D|nr:MULTISPECIES: glutamate--tRNA ligase [unclassified Methanoregula]OPX64030.1 MAG: Glutamate--tRNA ligase [Methanoregula sp. PtaB.Bin085]OPY33772.1 MAG: Glutamate--tRNA ligase [Methanoregula sp. PtaU1.Bin006]